MSKRQLHSVDPDVIKQKNVERATEQDDLDFEASDEDYESTDSEEILVQADSDDDEGAPGSPVLRAWLPGSQLAENEVLEVDPSAYEMLHNLTVKWPCLSFDCAKDSLGTDRKTYPATCYLVTATQADVPKHNELQVIKCSNLQRTSSGQFTDDASMSSEDTTIEEPVVKYISIPLPSGTNRVRITKSENCVRYAALLLESAQVYIFNLEAQFAALDTDSDNTILRDPAQNRPVHIVKTHSAEGFACAWCPLVHGRLLTGDNNGDIYLTTTQQGIDWTTDSRPFRGHRSSIEDIQWSPTEKTVFASCSADGTVMLWDTRSKQRSPAASFSASTCDVNVISWNINVPYLLATGDDNGAIAVWDLRQIKARTTEVTSVAQFQWHKAAITSIQWHPSEDSVLACSGADNQVTIWDLSVELDAEERANRLAEGLSDVPSQLMFVHMGQTDVKELHWHDQLPGVIITTALTGFNIFKTAYQQ